MLKVQNEITKYLIPQFVTERKNKTYFKWQKNSSYVEVLMPAPKIGKLKNTKAVITANICKNARLRITSSHDYEIHLLKYLLDVLTRSY